MANRKHTFIFSLLIMVFILSMSGFAQNNEIIVMDTRHVTKTYDMESGGDLYVKNINGDIRVTGWNNNKIEIDITRRGSRDDIEVFIDKRGRSFQIEVDYPDRRWYRRNNSGSIYFNIKVPVKTALEIRSTNGHVEATKIESQVEAVTTNGGVEVRDITGDAVGKSTNGKVEIFDITGRVDARSTNGNIRIRNTGDVNAHVTNGSIDILNTNGSEIEAGTTNGSIDIEMEKVDERGRYEMRSTNGRIRIAIPDNAKADITARTRPRDFHSDFDIFADYRDRDRDRRSRRYRYDYRYEDRITTFRGELNGGGARINISTSHGDVDIIKK